MLANSFWYFSLVFISLFIFILIYKKSNHFRKDLAVYFFAAGLSFFGEFVVLILFDAYNYYPRVFTESWPDNVFGSLISQAIIIPTVLMAIAAFQIRTRGVLPIIFAIALIEELFLWLGIYKHNWWKTWYTIALLLLGTFIMKWWRRKLTNSSKTIQFLTIYMVFNTFFHIISYFMSTVFKLSWYSIGWFESIYKDHIILNILIGVSITIPMTAIVLFSYNYLTLSALFIFIIIIDSVLIKLGLMHVIDDKVVIAAPIIYLIVVSVVKRLNDYFFSEKGSCLGE